ncbi:hypothetical protein [Azospirillum sp. ST 5-10]|uniref:hypothetical protein n=1 Tax=unclassified Azospirillum TaxID=2630922 RepID=UPI003F4A3065
MPIPQTPRPLRPAQPPNEDLPTRRPATDNPDLANPGPGLGDVPSPATDVPPAVDPGRV